ncbi:hemolysin family protein [Chloroflexota bacterium]
MSGHEILYLILFGICLLLSAFFSSSETAFFSMQKVRLKYLVDNQVKRAELVSRMLDQPARLLSTILLGNNLVNVAAAAIATTLAITYLPEDQGIFVATISTTIILLIFSETIPKTLATHHAERLSLTYARPLETISWIFTPLVVALSWIASVFSRLLGESSIPKTLFNVDDIRTMISSGHQEGEVGEPEAKMLHKAFGFSDLLVNEVMVPRLEALAIKQGSTLANFLALFVESPRSRFPVYRENMDNVTGILVTKDVFIAQTQGTINEQSVIDNLVRPAYFTPETKQIDRLFNDMKETNNQMAIVVDEFGGTAGIVSITGLIEEIVGEMGDELTATENGYEIINEYTFSVDGSMRIEVANEEMGLELPDSENYDTIAGFILSQLGHIPETNEQVAYKSFKLVVTEMRGFKIEEVRVTKESNVLSEDGY